MASVLHWILDNHLPGSGYSFLKLVNLCRTHFFILLDACIQEQLCYTTGGSGHLFLSLLYPAPYLSG